jgi:hypothetical protein
VNFYYAKIAFDTDVEYYNSCGGTVAATVNTIEGLLNRVDDIYARDVQIGYHLVAIVVRTTFPNPYDPGPPVSDSLPAYIGLLLTSLQAEWNNDSTSVFTSSGGALSGQFHLTDINPTSGQTTLVHLFTGKAVADESGNQIAGRCLGHGSICNTPTNAYTITSDNILDDYDDRRVNCLAHEIGHAWGATHCDNFFDSDCWYGDNLGIMLSTPPTWSSGFSPQSKREILAHLQNFSGCLEQGWIYVSGHATSPFWGTERHPFPTVLQGTQAVPSGGHVVIFGPSTYPENLTLNRAMTLSVENGPVTIGQ